MKSARSLASDENVAKSLKTFSARLAHVFILARVLIFLSYFAPILFTFVKNQEPGISASAIALDVFGAAFLACFGAAINIMILILFSTLATLYYAETRRLRRSLKNFMGMMKKRPFEFAVVAPAYSRMISEWMEVQMRIGPMAGVLAGCILSQTFSAFITLLYIEALTFLEPDDSTFFFFNTLTQLVSGVVIMVVYLILFVFLVNGMITANDRMTLVVDECAELQSTSASATVDNSALQSNCHGQDAIKMALLVDRRRYELMILGRATCYNHQRYRSRCRCLHRWPDNQCGK